MCLYKANLVHFQGSTRFLYMFCKQTPLYQLSIAQTFKASQHHGIQTLGQPRELGAVDTSADWLCTLD